MHNFNVFDTNISKTNFYATGSLFHLDYHLQRPMMPVWGTGLYCRLELQVLLITDVAVVISYSYLFMSYLNLLFAKSVCCITMHAWCCVRWTNMKFRVLRPKLKWDLALSCLVILIHIASPRIDAPNYMAFGIGL